MASSNPNAPFGFRLVRNDNGDYPRIDSRTASASVAIAPGSILRQKTDGTVAMWDGTLTNGGRLLIGGCITGVRTTTVDREVKVCISPEAEYEVQLSDGSVTGINGAILRNFNGSGMNAYNGTMLQSKAALKGSTGSSLNTIVPSSASRPFRVIRFSREIDNATSQSFARVVVKINAVNHALTSASGV